jgi:hypothetical protein
VRLVHSTEYARKNGSILKFEKSIDRSNHLAARARELVHLIFLVFLVSLVSLNKSNKIDQASKIHWLSLVVLQFVVRGLSDSTRESKRTKHTT